MNKCMSKLLVVALMALVPCLAFALPGAHDPNTGGVPGMICNSCHISPATFGELNAKYATNVCLRCHKPGDANTKKAFMSEDYADIDGTSNFITDQFGFVVSRGTPLKNSHKWLGAEVNVSAKAVKPIDTSPGGLNKSMVTGTLSCVRCHSVHGTSGDESNTAPFLRAANSKGQICTKCHTSRETTGHLTGSHPVNVSYTSASVKTKAALVPSQFYLVNGEPRKNTANTTAEMKNIQSIVVCSSCHGMHNADSDSATFDSYTSIQSQSDGSLLRVSKRGANNAVTTLNLCTNCHTKTHPLQINQHAKSTVVQCMDCHNAHVDVIDPADPVQTPNKFLLRRYMDYSGVKNSVVKLSSYRKRAVYTDAVNVGKWAAADGTGVCQACHKQPTTVLDHANMSQVKGDCIVCHANAPHTDTTPQGGCTNQCHGQPPVLAVYAPNTNGPASGYVAAGGYNESTTPHGSHAGASGTNYAFSCDQCHRGASHESLNYRQVFLAGQMQYQLAGSSAVYNTGTCSAMYCHSDGAGSNFKSVSQNGTKGSIIGAAPATRCAACHSLTPTTSSHPRHTTFNYGCVSCHATTVVTNNTTLLATAYGPSGTHVNGIKDVSFSGVLPAQGATCATVYCHTNGKGSAPLITPSWGAPATGACNACHYTYPNLVTNAHSIHYTAIGGTSNAALCFKCHSYASETAATHVNGTLNTNYDGTGCATNLCHGTIPTPTWSFDYTGKDTCTKCHGILSDTATTAIATNKYLFAPITSAGKGVGTGNVVTGVNSKKGAHETHLRYLNGFSNYSTQDYRCASCHVVPASGTAHVNQNALPVFSKMANKNGALTPTYGAGTGSCTNTYCHNPQAYGTVTNPGTAPVPVWNDATYTAEGGKSLANCQKCHLVPGSAGFALKATHDSAGILTTDSTPGQCTTCHGHSGDLAGAIGQRHLDGKRPAASGGGCDGCHGYPPVSNMTGLGVTNNFINAKIDTFNGGYAGGGSYHTAHLSPTITIADGFTPCLPCHPDESQLRHHNNSSTVSVANVDIFYAGDTSYRFDSTRPKQYTKTANATFVANSCGNISCHFKPTTPAWY